MKYLVNRETKEHIVYHEEHSLPLKGWDIVQADSDGWIPWSTDEDVCPVPGAAAVWVRFLRRTKGASEYEADTAGGIAWDDPTITHYRPIITEQTGLAPTEPESLQSATERFVAAINSASEAMEVWSANLAALKEPLAAVPLEPDEDMSDWRNWREGDLLECTSWEGGAFNEGHVYPCVSGSVISPTLGSFMLDRSLSKHFRFHSRPKGATK